MELGEESICYGMWTLEMTLELKWMVGNVCMIERNNPNDTVLVELYPLNVNYHGAPYEILCPSRDYKFWKSQSYKGETFRMDWVPNDFTKYNKKAYNKLKQALSKVEVEFT